ncbi:MAG: NADH:ubiquinone oxidoreductase, NADH-binding (51 kD) subunit [Desulfotomaculum sp. 46_296]|nr:MAG: NADH:ubiquinone oxidoreductase, NADH-binding (51 kD) subunit [Desulfotomaculum sp. 46_296]HAU32004.1 NADH-quinone oxidoreductase subunit F [Desulfotomaculum sp.]
MARINSYAELEELRKSILLTRDPNKTCITLCSGSACHASGSKEVAMSFEEELNKQGLNAEVDFRKTGCHGFCERGPIVVIYPEEICYFQIKPEDVPEIISQTIKEKKIIERLLYTDISTKEKIVHESEIPFYRDQGRLVFGSNVNIDPKSIDDYLAQGGYAALAKALFQMTPEQVLEEVKKSNLRGRGGGGFPTGRKWAESRNAPGDVKYVIVNADEGDPGAYMDRSLLEGNPHSVLEGLAIGAYTIGSNEGFIYVRQEYPLAVENVNIAIKHAEEHGLLGKNILGSGFDFSIKVHKGAGAFVCGESSALMTALEGKAGEPRPKYIHTAVKGVWDKPSVLNNVETWANVPLIINKGADWFTQYGTETSKGTKIFSLVGKINNTGLVEVPMGTTLRDIIFKIGGGIPGGKKFKAVQTGGPSGGCIPESMLDLEVGFDELTKVGSMMGSGGMIVMDEETCMVDVARYFLEFLTDESCGKCVPCREGIRQMLKTLTNITKGKGKDGDIELLEELAETAVEAALCALGKSAPNPFLSTLKYFRDEYEAHVYEKRCPAMTCKELISFYIDPTLCQACMNCGRKCPTGAIIGGKNLIHVVDQEKCSKCGTCFEVCPPRFRAVKKISGEPVPPPIPEEQRVIVRGKGKGAKENE